MKNRRTEQKLFSHKAIFSEATKEGSIHKAMMIEADNYHILLTKLHRLALAL